MQFNSGERLGPYEIVGPLGAGGMGEVYRAIDTRLQRNVAVKTLPATLAADAQLRLRFEREAKTISQLNHPNICTLYDVGDDYIVMELLEGETLADRIVRGALPLRETLKIAVQIADALDRAHRAGIVHRDLKPGNIMLTRGGAKLLDFGLARSTDATITEAPAGDATEHKPLTQEGTIVGTFHYMAPEQIEGESADHRSDIFAFGAVVYEMLTGRRAFEGKTRASLIAAVLEHDPPSVREIQPVTPPALERLIRTCLEKDPDERWQSAHDVRRELEWIQSDSSTPSGAVPSHRRLLRLPSARQLAGLLLVASVAAAGSWFAALRFRSEPPRRIVSNIVAPEGTSFIPMGDAGGPVTLSPDGRHAVFTALGADGAMLWLQTLESGSVVPLPGTDQGMFPFWSPDSGSIGFFAGSKLMVAEIGGPLPRAIADAPDGRGGFWGEAGILFTPFTRAPIYLIAPSGGEAIAVTKIEPPYTTHRWPAFLPDGKRFVYLAANHADPTSPETAVFVASIEEGASTKIVSSLTSAIPFRDWLLFPQGNTLVAQRLAPQGLEGARVTLWERTLLDPGTWRTIASVSSTGLLATYSSTATTNSRLVWVDRRGKEIGSIEPDAVYRDISISPDGKKVAMSIGDPMSAIYVHDLVSDVRTRFSFVGGSAGEPLWTRDGKSVVFETLVTADHYEMYTKPADGSANERKIYETKDPIRTTDIDPDGRVVFDLENRGDIFSVSTDGSAAPVIAGPGRHNSAAVSPDGRWIAYVQSHAPGRAAFISPYPAITSKWQIAPDAVMAVFWSGNGKEIVYLTADGQMKSVAVSVRGESIQLGAPELLFRVNVNTNARSFALAPDGSRFLIIDPRIDELGAATLISNFDTALN